MTPHIRAPREASALLRTPLPRLPDRTVSRLAAPCRVSRRTARILVLTLASAALLAGCTSAGTSQGSDAEGGFPSASAPATHGSEPAGPPPEGTLLITDVGADTVTFVDPDKGPFDSVTVGEAPYGLVVGGHVHVGVNVPSGNGILETIDTTTREVTGTTEVGRRPFAVDASEDGREDCTTHHDSFDVTVLEVSSGATRRLEAAPYGTEGGLGSWLKPRHTAVRPSDGRLLLPFEGERLVVLDPATAVPPPSG